MSDGRVGVMQLDSSLARHMRMLRTSLKVQLIQKILPGMISSYRMVARAEQLVQVSVFCQSVFS